MMLFALPKFYNGLHVGRAQFRPGVLDNRNAFVRSRRLLVLDDRTVLPVDLDVSVGTGIADLHDVRH